MGVRRGDSMGLAVVLAVFFVAVLASFSQLSGVSAAVINLTPTSNWKANLTFTGHPAGTVINLAEGYYSHSGRLGLNLKGSLNAPIIIQGPSNGNAVIIQTNPSGANAMEVDGSNFVLKNFKLKGGSLGLRLGVASNITNVLITALEIYQTQGTALTLNTADSTYLRLHKNVTVKNCHFHDTNYGIPAGSQTGECLYFGTDPVCTGSCPDCTCTVKKVYVANSLIKGNLCSNTLNSKPGWGSGFQIKGGSNGISIVDNTCYNTKGPCILTYATSYAGFAGAVNRVARNLAWNSYDIAIQTTQGHVITDNIILGSTHPYGIGIIPNKGTPGNVKIVGNTIFGGSVSSIYASGISKAATGSIIIANNAIFATTAGFKLPDTAAVVNAKVIARQNGVNGPLGYTFASPNVNSTFVISAASVELVNTTAYDLKPKSNSKLLNKASTDATAVDFDCNPRPTTSTKSVGALQYFNPAKATWTIAPNKKKSSPNCQTVN